MSDNRLSDPFEQAFHDYLSGDFNARIMVYNSKGDDEVMEVSYFFRHYESMPQLEKIALNHCHGHVLDVGAGSGCHSLFLQDRGYEVTAMDIRPGFVEVMKKRGIKNVLHADVQLLRKGKYDTLLMLMNGIGLTRDFKGLAKFLKGARHRMNPGGQLLLDSSDLIYLCQEEDGSVKVNLNENYYGEVEYQVEYKGIKGIPFQWLFVDFTNLALFAGKAGFRCELLFEDENFNYLARLY